MFWVLSYNKILNLECDFMRKYVCSGDSGEERQEGWRGREKGIGRGRRIR
jgi:hypothetical protein